MPARHDHQQTRLLAKPRNTSSVSHIQVLSRLEKTVSLDASLDRIIDHADIERFASDRPKHSGIAKVTFTIRIKNSRIS